MRRVLLLAVAVSLAASARAADVHKPNTLTPQEVADGWILLWDGETTYGWRSPNDSQWTIADGMLAPQADKAGLPVMMSMFRDYELQFDYRYQARGSIFVTVGGDSEGGVDKEGNFPVHLPRFETGWTHTDYNVLGGYLIGGNYTAPGWAAKAEPSTRPKPRSGHIAFSGNGAGFRNIKLKPTNAQSLFNGKDLTGWKEFPGKKSKFSVTKEGWIHLEDGPGDLQSEGSWADFVLQLECISNGDHCNSGVFLRCRPGEFEQGYEAQIRNEFTAEPKQEYAVEEYDPKTHELKETKKIKYTAVDYGTGAIYRRMPARKELSKDREWFGMTVAASGRHFAVWVNGVQATDWTDNRPSADNARKGCTLEKGPISLQGHEAAVEDSDFRNIRIADLAPAPEKQP